MSRLSQYIAFLNAEKAPTEEEMRYYYTDLEKTPELMEARRKYRGEIKKQKGRPPITEHYDIPSEEVKKAVKQNNKIADGKR